MAKVNREIVIAEALDLLDEVGLDAITTRQLAKRLGVEQPTLYWHFKTKAQLLAAMADAAITPHAAGPPPAPGADWRDWLREHTRSFRRTLLIRRDGARLHAGSRPGADDMERIRRIVAFFVAAGLREHDAMMGMLAANRFTVGSVLEEQADVARDLEQDEAIGIPSVDYSAAFEAGLTLIVEGMNVASMRAGKC
jgi:TetR/AcrR family tetracycline transcriptional repressor